MSSDSETNIESTCRRREDFGPECVEALKLKRVVSEMGTSHVYKEYVTRAYDLEGGDCGASWLMLEELIDFDWDQKVSRFAYVKRKYAKLFHKNEPFPENFPEDEEIYHGLFQSPPKGTVKVHWCVSVAEYVSCHRTLIEALERLGPKEKVRMIYWFNC